MIQSANEHYLLDQLIATLESATEGSRELDRTIQTVIAPGEYSIITGIPRYTTSLYDAALLFGSAQPATLRLCIAALKARRDGR